MTRLIAVCLGGAATVWDDLARAQAMLGDTPHIVVACNYAGITYPGHLDAWVTLHPERFAAWRDDRAAMGLNDDYRRFTHDDASGDTTVAAYTYYGSSGLYMAQVAIERLGADRVILCGVPMDDTGGHIHWPGSWGHAHHYRAAFERAHAANWPIRSMSGWTAELFGAPDADFLGQPAAAMPVAAAPVEESAMAWVRFTADFTFHFHNGAIDYRAGYEGSVTRACRDAAVKDGKAAPVKTPGRAERQRLKFQPTIEDATDGV